VVSNEAAEEAAFVARMVALDCGQAPAAPTPGATTDESEESALVKRMRAYDEGRTP
jgi:hypothetical protein